MNNRERNIQKACILYKKPLEAEFNYIVYLSLKNVTESINYDALNEEQNLFKNKIILKADIMDKNIIKKIGNLMKDEWFDIDAFFKEYGIG